MAASTAFDRMGGAILMLLGAGAAWHGHGLEVAFAADPVGPKAFPIIVGLILAVCGASILLRPSEVEWHAGDYGRVIAVAAASLAYPLLLEPLGFVPATALLGFVVAKALKGGTVQSAISSICMAAVILLLIDVGLGLGLPRGPLGI
ncbi:MAG: tripartite tricarboxylate transporter TctB family protein [Phyllobacterium sp.]